MTQRKEVKMVLLQDLIIPKGTVFHEAPKKTERSGRDHYQATIGLSVNTSGSIEYCIDDDPNVLSVWFTTLK